MQLVLSLIALASLSWAQLGPALLTFGALLFCLVYALDRFPRGARYLVDLVRAFRGSCPPS